MGLRGPRETTARTSRSCITSERKGWREREGRGERKRETEREREGEGTQIERERERERVSEREREQEKRESEILNILALDASLLSRRIL